MESDNDEDESGDPAGVTSQAITGYFAPEQRTDTDTDEAECSREQRGFPYINMSDACIESPGEVVNGEGNAENDGFLEINGLGLVNISSFRILQNFLNQSRGSFFLHLFLRQEGLQHHPKTNDDENDHTDDITNHRRNPKGNDLPEQTADQCEQKPHESNHRACQKRDLYFSHAISSTNTCIIQIGSKGNRNGL